MVGARGFEPPTPCTPCRCATRLRHAPTISGTYRKAGIITYYSRTTRVSALTTQDLENFFELNSNLLYDLLTLIDIFPRFLTGKTLPCASDSEALLIKKAPDLPDDQNILTLIITTVPPTLHRLELRKLLLPIA
jgi:hypothetical protein